MRSAPLTTKPARISARAVWSIPYRPTLRFSSRTTTTITRPRRGYHPRSLNSNDGWNVTSPLSLLNAKLLAYADEIRSAVLVIHGDQAHSCYFSRDAFARLQGDNKELLLIPGAVHTDLYDRMDIIPFDRIEAFYHQYLK